MAGNDRYSIVAVLACAYLLSYVDRMVMASAIPFIAEDFHLSPLSMGVVLGAFFVGYTAMQFPGGLVADRFGPRAVLAISVGCWSIFTALTATASGLTSLVIIRVLFGLGEGPFPPATSKALSIWFPRKELARANGFLLASTAIGATVAPLLTANIVRAWGWRPVFYGLLAPGLLVAALVWYRLRTAPHRGPDTAQEEPLSSEPPKPELSSPASAGAATWTEALHAPAVLWCALGLFLANLVSWGLLNWLPTYLLRARGLDPERMGLFAALANFGGVIGYPLGGYLCDRYFSANLRIPILLGMTVSGLFTCLAAFATSGEWAVVCLLVVSMALNVAGVAICTLPLVIVPGHLVGSSSGIVNTAGQLAGVFSPILVGYVLTLSHGDFSVVLYSWVVAALITLVPASQIRQIQRPIVEARSP